MKKYQLIAGVLACGFLSNANATPIREIIEAHAHPNTGLLNRYAEKAPSVEKQLASGLLYALKGNDDQATTLLQQALLSTDLTTEDRSDILRDLAHVQFRQGLYQAAEKTLASMLKDTTRTENTEEDFQDLDIYRALSGVPRTRVITQQDGNTAVIRDAQNLPRISININHVGKQAVVDTDANTSVVMESVAKKLKMHIIGSNLKGGSSTSDIDVRFAVADDLNIAGMHYTNVVFAVLPDSDLTFVGGKYRIEAILGFPELVKLHCIKFVKEEKQEIMSWSHDSSCTSGGNELFFVGLTPVMNIQTKEPDADLSFELDTGANKTQLQAGGFAKLVINSNHLTTSDDHIGGAGKTVTESNQHIDKLTFLRGEQEVALKDITIRELPKSNEHHDGLLGQDLLSVGKGYIIDFVHMRVQWL